MPGDGSIGEQGGLNCVRGRLPKKLQVTRPDYRHAEIESLAYVTSPLLERLQLGGRLHALGPVSLIRTVSPEAIFSQIKA
jgi:hypothetical protein